MLWNWNDADTYLKGGRKKYERPLYDRSLRIWKENPYSPDSDINIGWGWNGQHSTFVTYHKDGSTTIQGAYQTTHWGSSWTPLRSNSVKLTIHRYAGIQVFQRNFKFYLQEHSAPLTQPKIQGCRKCSQTGLQNMWCYYQTCYEVERDGDKAWCQKHPDTFIHGSYGNWHNAECIHGEDKPHNVLRGQKCYSCGGSGKRDYGSKPFRTLWDGSPLRLRDGKIIKSTAATLLERMMTDHVESVS
jgi:hypothetical protein